MASGFLWTFGDSNFSTGLNPSHSYSNTGIYTVALSGTDGENTGIEEKVNYITVLSELDGNVDFTGSPLNIGVGSGVDFTAIAPDATGWLWHFGDSNSSSQQNPSHTYNSAGSFDVALSAQHNADSGNLTKENYVNVFSEVSGNFSVDDTIAIRGQNLSFSSTTSGVTDFLWNFGDGSTSTQENPQHSYSQSGYYDVILTYSNLIFSGVESKSAYITVSNQTAGSSFTPSEGQVIGTLSGTLAKNSFSVFTPNSRIKKIRETTVINTGLYITRFDDVGYYPS